MTTARRKEKNCTAPIKNRDDGNRSWFKRRSRTSPIKVPFTWITTKHAHNLAPLIHLGSSGRPSLDGRRICGVVAGAGVQSGRRVAILRFQTTDCRLCLSVCLCCLCVLYSVYLQ